MMNWILILGVFEAVFLSALVLVKKNKAMSDYYLISYLLLMGVTIMGSYLELYNYAHDFPYPIFLNTAPVLLFLHGPMLWFYVKALTEQPFHFRLVYLVHLLPFFLAFAAMYLSVYSMPLEERLVMIRSGAFRNGIVYPAVLAGIFFINQAYFVYALLMIRRYRRNLKNYFSKIDHIDLAWLRFLLISGIIAYAFNSLLFILDYFYEFLGLNSLMLITFIIGSLFILALGFYGQRQTNIFQNPRLDFHLNRLEEQKPVKQPEAMETEEEKFIRRLTEFMEDQQAYCSPDLTVSKLAEQLRVSPEYLSGILNRYLYKNFFDFVNDYRVRAFKTKVRNPEYRNFTLLSIAYDCGFNSKATFNRVFKNATGVTPSAYAKGVSEK